MVLGGCRAVAQQGGADGGADGGAGGGADGGVGGGAGVGQVAELEAELKRFKTQARPPPNTCRASSPPQAGCGAGGTRAAGAHEEDGMRRGAAGADGDACLHIAYLHAVTAREGEGEAPLHVGGNARSR